MSSRRLLQGGQAGYARTSGEYRWRHLYAAVPRRASAISLAVALSACSSFSGAPPPPVDATAETAGLQSLHDAPAIVACLKTPRAQQTTCRDAIVDARMIATDTEYRKFRLSFDAEARWGGFAATVASLGLTSAASLSGIGHATAQALSAIATGVTGTRAAYEKELLAERALTAIENSMDAARQAVAIRVRTGQTQPADKYTLSEALSDLEDYYSAGTLLGSIANISAVTGAQKQETSQQLTELARGGRLSDSPSMHRIENWVRPNGVLDKSHRDQLQNWLNANAVLPSGSALAWPALLNDPTGENFEGLRQRIINALKIP
jgi:hypothetical protein